MILCTALLLFIGNGFASAESENAQIVKNATLVSNSVSGLSVNISKLVLNDLKPEGNFIFSPLNTYEVLSLVHLGATGTTKKELSSVLGLPVEENKSAAEVREHFGKLLTNIQKTSADGIQVNIANGVFVQKGLKLKENYLNEAKNYYQSKTQQLDFAKGGPEATNAVNKWVADETKNQVKDLFNDELSKNTQILTASALYFAGEWARRFNKSYTQTKNFNTGVKQIQIPTMTKNLTTLYLNNKDLKFEAASISYAYADFVMIIHLPYPDQPLKTLVNSLKPEDLDLSKTAKSFKAAHVNYQVPQMKFRWTHDITEQLKKLGLKQMFDKAELGNMVDSKNISVSKVTHTAELEVNEEGTLSSAIPKVQSSITSTEQPNPDTPIPFHVDRPFLFSIYHLTTKVILFTGVVQNPADVNA
ncbi:serpin B4-like [Planococcus citri]|uniref:serpin B4-like n=1 Tax=Planococcus citri TaxID=170843 RepID=UPI0031F851A2